MAAMTTVSVDKPTAEQLRLAKLDMSAAERRQLSTSETLRRLIDAWHQRNRTANTANGTQV